MVAVNVEVASAPATAAGEAVAQLAAQLVARLVTSITVSSTSTAQTTCTVHLGSVLSPIVAGTISGNGDTAGGSPIILPAGMVLFVRWIKADPGSECRAVVGLERPA